MFDELYAWLYAFSCSILRCSQLIIYSFLSVTRFRAKNFIAWVFRLNFILNFVYTFQAIVIFLTGIVWLLLAKLELFFVNFSSISNTSKMKLHVGKPYDALFINWQHLIFWQFHGLFSLFAPLITMKTSLVFLLINTAAIRCVMWLFKARAVQTSKNCRLD